MRLSELIPEALEGRDDATTLASLEASGLHQDSRRVGPGDVFFAISGLTVDGHDFAARAAAAGAVAVVSARPLDLPVPCLPVADPTRLLGLAASRLHGEPCQKLAAVGLTGTNGKTTTAYLLEGMLSAAGRRPGLVGTVAYRYAGKSTPSPFTTPTPLELQALLAEMVAADCDHLVMEVSSHGLELGRVWGCDFEVAAFTHLTQDHLDLHGSMEAYLEAKLLLFSRHLRPGGTAVVNVDGQGAGRVVETVRRRNDVRLLRCSRQPDVEAELRFADLESDIQGLSGTLELGAERVPLRSPLLGAYNADNLLLAAGCAHALGVPLSTIASAAGALPGVPGRLERVDDGQAGFAVLVDYAHTPDALERALEVLRPLCTGRLLGVFGCGGDRDRAKRPLMGQAVARGADIAVVTSDNPRSEDPLQIIAEILPGVRPDAGPALNGLTDDPQHGYWVEADRRRAIQGAVLALRAGDILLIAGKGHEDYQILGNQRIHFDDREEARAALAARSDGDQA